MDTLGIYDDSPGFDNYAVLVTISNAFRDLGVDITVDQLIKEPEPVIAKYINWIVHQAIRKSHEHILEAFQFVGVI